MVTCSDEAHIMDVSGGELDLVKDLLSEKVLRMLQGGNSGRDDDTEDDVDLIGAVAVITQTFANAGLLNFIYLPLEDDEQQGSPSDDDQSDRYARFSVDRAYIDEDAQNVVTLQGDIIAMSDPEPILEIEQPAE